MTVVVALFAALHAPGALAQSAVTMFSEPGDYVGGGLDRTFYPGPAQVSVSGNAGYLTVSVSGGASGDAFSLVFAAPPGQTLVPGLYSGAQRAAFRTSGHPGMDIFGDGRGCNTDSGRFDVKDIGVASDGGVRRLWLTYEQHCEGGLPALFGEVRWNVPGPADVLVAPRMVWWPDADLGAAGKTVPISVANTGATDLGLAGVTEGGPNTADFPIRLDECSGATLAPGDACQVFVRFVPTKPGPRLATLVLADDSGRKLKTALDAFAWGGKTKLVLRSDPGDWVGQGQTYSYTPANASFDLGGTRSHLSGAVRASDGSWWDTDFASPSGDILVPGTTYSATRYPFNGTGAGMSIEGNGRGCNTLTGTFTVTALAFGADGSVHDEGINFTQYCDGSSAALRGSLDYRVPSGDTTPPGQVSSLAVSRSGTCADLTWANPTDADFARTIVRYLPGANAPALANSGLRGYAGAGTAAHICGLSAARPLALSAFTLDAEGNVGRRVTAFAAAPS